MQNVARPTCLRAECCTARTGRQWNSTSAVAVTERRQRRLRDDCGEQPQIGGQRVAVACTSNAFQRDVVLRQTSLRTRPSETALPQRRFRRERVRPAAPRISRRHACHGHRNAATRCWREEPVLRVSRAVRQSRSEAELQDFRPVHSGTECQAVLRPGRVRSHI